jgi:hypothetical protein
MSYQYTSNSDSHRLQEFVPTYVPKSDYLPTRVVDSNQSEANQWVHIIQYSFPPTKDRKDKDTSTPRDPQSSTPIDMSPSRPMKMSWSINPSPKTSSTAESGDTDLHSHGLSYIYFISLTLNAHTLPHLP